MAASRPPSAPRRFLAGLLLRLALRLRLRLLLGRALPATAARGTAGLRAAIRGAGANGPGARPHGPAVPLPPLPALVAGLAAAGAGLVLLAVPVLLLWMTSPYPDGGPGNALHTTAALWLLAHGVELVRTETLSGVPAPVGVAPLLLTALPVLLLHRAGRFAAEGGRDEDATPPRPTAAWAGVTAGYLAAGLVAALYATGGEYRPGWGWTTLCLPALTAVLAAGGVWAGCDRPRQAVDRWEGRLPDLLLGRADRGRRLTAVFRAAGEGTAALLGGGALLAVVALALRAGDAGEAFGRLAGGWLDGVTLLLLCLALLPSAAVWAASYALGPGFAVGPAVVTPLGVGGAVPALPVFPWLAAVPAGGLGTAPAWGLAAVPVLAGAAIGARVARRAAAARVPWPWLRTAVLAALACLLGAAALAALTALASGPIGTGALAAFGPSWWRTGLAAAAWTLPPALLTALLARWDLLRR
ncbi:cell division protein PerM [Streptomyces abyssomicinicus]|uniref:cell division protein PerM n=1 Tax=Streptomyces abyssomicinicus TaxID=574929 RepID=UPI00124FC780|nr:DUF6350 family protein [Streptomyces abyssomicinicus]